jgi:GNAT superfamily N-acetyltransferase
MIAIRPAALCDTSELARLNTAFNDSREPPAAYAVRLAAADRVDHPILAWAGERAVGLANLRLLLPALFPDAYAEITELFVEEQYRRLGIGRQLVAFAEEMARAAGARSMLILTNYYNHPAQQLYRSQGYEPYDIALFKSLL